MMLSVITMICDGTEELLNPWIQNVKENVHINHEIIVVDNTTEQSLPEMEGVTVVRMGHNAMQFAGRRRGVETALGDYVYLVDCDDELLPINHFDWDEDMICFNYMSKLENDDETYMCSEPYRISYTASKGVFFDYSWRLAVKNMVWNKFIKRESLMNIYNKLPYFELSFMEDVLLNLFLLAEVQTIRFETKAYYKYYFGTGISTKKKYTSMVPINRLFAGMETALSVFNLAFNEEAQKQSGITTIGFYRGCITYALQKYENIDDSLLEEYTKLIADKFEKKVLLDVLKTLPEKEINRKTMLKAKHCIQDYM